MYDAFPLLGVLAVLYTAAVLVAERRLELRPVLFAGIGIALGLVINPYFPDNIIFAIRHILPKITEATSTSVGNEWYPYTTAQLLENSPLALAAFVAGAFALGLSGRRMQTSTAASFFVAFTFGVLLFQSRRYVEYFPPFALLFAALAWAPVLSRDGGAASSEQSCFRRLTGAPVPPGRAAALGAGGAAGDPGSRRRLVHPAAGAEQRVFG